MAGPPDRFELSIAERLGPVLRAIEKRRARAEHRRMMATLEKRGLTAEESKIGAAPGAWRSGSRPPSPALPGPPSVRHWR
jgi:hypothetical protein